MLEARQNAVHDVFEILKRSGRCSSPIAEQQRTFSALTFIGTYARKNAFDMYRSYREFWGGRRLYYHEGSRLRVYCTKRRLVRL